MKWGAWLVRSRNTDGGGTPSSTGQARSWRLALANAKMRCFCSYKPCWSPWGSRDSLPIIGVRMHVIWPLKPLSLANGRRRKLNGSICRCAPASSVLHARPSAFSNPRQCTTLSLACLSIDTNSACLFITMISRSKIRPPLLPLFSSFSQEKRRFFLAAPPEPVVSLPPSRKEGNYMAKKVSFGLTLPNRGVVLGITTVREMLDLSVEAEKSGVFDSIWAGDSLAAKPRLEAITLLSAVAARTERVKLGPACFASFPLRHPILLAYQWASFDVVCEGRSIMVACQGARGTGSGDSETEWAAMGLDLSERAHRMEEGIEILRKLWAGKNVSHQGRFYQFKDLTIEPKPVQNPCPIWIANNPHIFGASEKLLNHIARRVARMADGWQTTFTTPEAFKLGWERIERQAKEIGRDVSNMPRCLYYNCHINEDRNAALKESKEFLDAYYAADWTPQQLNLWVAMGSPQECIRTIQSHVEAGADIITIRFPARNQTQQFERFVNEVYPAFQ